MEFDFNTKYTTVAVYSLIVLLFTVLCVFAGLYFSSIIGWIAFFFDILKPLIYGFIFAFMFCPLLRLFEERLFAFVDIKNQHPRLRAALALALTYIVVFSVITLFAMIIIPQAVTSYNDLQLRLSGYVAAAQNWINKALDDLPVIDIIFSASPPVRTAAPAINPDGSIPNIIVTRLSGQYDREMYDIIRASQPESAHYDIAEIINMLIANSYKAFSDITPYILTAAMNFVKEMKNLLLGLIISAYYLAARKSVSARLKFIMETFLSRKTIESTLDFASLVNQSFTQFVNGKIIDAAILGVLCFIFMSIFRMPYAPLISLLVGVTNVIPYIGPFLGAIPGAFILFVSDPPMAFWFVLLIIGLQQADMYLIEPRVMQSQIKLDSHWIMLSVIITGGLLGIVGLFVGVPLFAIFYTLLKRRAEYMLEKKGLPKETSDWLA